MNDFSELERELKKLRPVQPSAELISRVGSALANSGEGTAKVIRPEQFRINWLGLGLGLAAAATFLIFARVDFHPNERTKQTIASATPSLQQKAAALPNYQATGLTQVVYSKRDEGLVFPAGAEGPSRRVRTAKREMLQWRDRHSGAQLAVSYPDGGGHAHSSLRSMNFPQIQFGLRLLASPPGAGNTDFQVCAPNRLLACFTSAGYKPAGRTGRNACVSIRRTGAFCESLPFQPYHPLKTANTNENRNHHPNCR